MLVRRGRIALAALILSIEIWFIEHWQVCPSQVNGREAIQLA